MKAWQINLCCIGLFLLGSVHGAATEREIRWLVYAASFGALVCWLPLRGLSRPTHDKGR